MEGQGITCVGEWMGNPTSSLVAQRQIQQVEMCHLDVAQSGEVTRFRLLQSCCLTNHHDRGLAWRMEAARGEELGRCAVGCVVHGGSGGVWGLLTKLL